MPAIPLMLLVDGRQTESRRVQPAAGFGRMRNAAKRFHQLAVPGMIGWLRRLPNAESRTLEHEYGGRSGLNPTFPRPTGPAIPVLPEGGGTQLRNLGPGYRKRSFIRLCS
jgi:hypothetical protein